MKRAICQFNIIFISLSSLFLITTPARGQLIPDKTLGRENSKVIDPNRTRINIEGGANRGANLFHSFQEFNIAPNREVYFANPTGVRNILTRVTGGNISKIFGKLGVVGNANLFLINPNGILFGKGASLDIKGSFIGTTADGIKLGEKGSFSAIAPANDRLLTVQPGALFTNAIAKNSATITNHGNLSAGQNLFLSGDRLDLKGQLFAGENLILQGKYLKIRDSLAEPFIASARSNLTVEGQEKLDIFALNHPQSGLFSGKNLVLRSANHIIGDGNYWSGNNFSIEKLDRTKGNWISIKDPIIRSRGNVIFNEYTGASLKILAGGSVNVPGIITIVSPDPIASIPSQVTLSDGTLLSLNPNIRPTLDIRAGVNLSAGDLSLPVANNFFPNIITFDFPTSADINIGGIVMLGENAANGQVLLTNQYQPNLALPGGNIRVGPIVTSDRLSGILTQLPPQLSNALQLPPGVNPDFTGDGGDVIIDSRKSIRSAFNPFLGREFSFINTSSSSGNSGDIKLLAREGIGFNDSFIVADALGIGKGGNIALKASAIDLNNTIVSSNIQPTAIGNGGNINIETNRLRLTGDTRILTINSSINPNSIGGNIDITATELLDFMGIQERPAETVGNGIAFGNLNLANIQSIISTVVTGNGSGGNLTINTDKLTAQKAIISTGTLSQGNGGRLNINQTKTIAPTDTIELIDAVIFSPSAGAGNANDARINTGSLIIRDRSQISTNTFGSGNAGNLFINATESVELSSSSIDRVVPTGLFASTIGSTGAAGDITINTKRVIVRDGGQINVVTGSNNPFFQGQLIPGGPGGNITINATESVTLDGVSQVSNGFPGPSTITTETYSPFDGGKIRITTGKLTLSGGAQISTATFFTGNAGELNIVANEIDLRGAVVQFNPNNTVSGTGIFSLAQRPRNVDRSVILGAGGRINLTGNTLTLTEGAQISSQTNSSQGGDIAIDLNERLILQGNSIISTTGGVERGSGNGGNIRINSPLIVAFPRNNQIIANAFSGDGGDINIRTNAIFGYPQFLTIAASSNLGIDGNINFIGLNNDLSRGAIALPESPVDVDKIIANDPCRFANEAIAGGSSFTIIGKGGIAPNPRESVETNRRLLNWSQRPDQTNNSKSEPITLPTTVSTTPIQQAVGWWRKSDGTIVLTANPQFIKPLNLPSIHSSCQQ